MTEQQADALMERIGTLTKFMEWQKEVGFSPTFEVELELAALTALCRHRDQLVYGVFLSKLWKLDRPDLQNRIDDMQTWENV